ncbi:MAG: 2-amino-4-hydroxy-6-hydroxymethyldihydropteridine diphosphokinase [Pseudomonadota bacterium]
MRLHLIALGANLGFSRRANARKVAAAAARLGALGRQATLSGLYATPAWPPASGPDYVNAVVAVWSTAAPEAMLERLHRLETAAGRTRNVRWSARILDLDLLATGCAVRPSPSGQRAWVDMSPGDQAAATPDRLILPHPRLADRAFVLVPLCDVAPDWRHPLTGRSARAMRNALPGEARRQIRRLAMPT